MSSNASRACEQSTSSVKKRKLHEPVSYIKKLRSKIPRRKRFQIAPIFGGFENSVDNETEFSVTQVISNSSCFPDEISSSSNWIPVGSVNLNKSRSNRRKRETEEEFLRGNEIRSSRQLERNSGESCRRKTRSYYRNKVGEKLTEKGDFNRGVELSETSCVESFSGVEARVLSNVDQFSERKLKFKARARRVSEKEEIIEGDVDSSTVALSETSCIQPFSEEIIWKNCDSGQISGESSVKKARKSTEIQVNDLVVTSSLESPFESKVQKLCSSSVHDVAEKVTIKEGNRVGEASFSEISKKYVESKLEVADSESTADQIPKEFEYDYSLACSEHFSFEDGSEYSPIHDYEMTLSELESDLFPRIPYSQSSEYTPSLVIESPSDFSERSPESTPPAYFSFLLHYTKQFCKLSSSEEVTASRRAQEEYSEEFPLLRFEDEFHEESYQRFRSRERNLVLHDYTEKYYSTTDYGDLVLQQRMVMVNWIVEQANERELQFETMFLGVSLMDRFLSKGFFRNKRKLQMLGIACLALATRIEENQPYNCIRQRTFRVGSNGYSRCEVVAMEWLVQEVLHFQCFLPTTYNFLWFYLKAARANSEVEKIARFLAVLSLLDHERLSYWPSTIAAGLVILAALAANQDASCHLVMETHVRTKNDDLTECIKCLEWLVKYVC